MAMKMKILSTLVVLLGSGLAGHAAAMPLARTLPADQVGALPAVVRFYLYTGQETLAPLAVADFGPGQFRIEEQDGQVRLSAELQQDLDAEELWVETELDGKLTGERVALAISTPGVTFALGNYLDMDGNFIVNLATPVDPGDAANKQFVLDQIGSFSETDPTVLESVKDGVDWSELSGIPAGFSDGTDDVGVTSEADPTVLASVKDGVAWGELQSIPVGFADGIDNQGVTSVTAGTGLSGGTITSTGTINVAVPLALSGSAAYPTAVIKGTNTSGIGVAGTGATMGGSFEDSNGSGAAFLAYGHTGVDAEGSSYGGDFSSSGTTGRAVQGIASATGAGVWNYGGYFEAHGDSGRAVGAVASGADAYAFKGIADATGAVTNYGGHFTAKGNTGRAVVGVADATGTTQNYGGYFTAAGITGVGVYGSSTYGVWGEGVHGGHFEGSEGVFARSTTSTGGAGVYGESSASSGTAEGVKGYVSGSGTANIYGVYGSVGSSSNSGARYAGYFSGNVHVSGTLSKPAGSFIIDHPLDPENKTLSHSFVESPDMMNIYNGNAELDQRGEAVIELPDWFEALNRDFRYQLTTIGGFAPVYVAEEINGNRFRIAGGTAGMKVSWQVTGIRHDPYAEQNPIVVEADKPEKEVGSYLNAAAYGMPEERSVEWARDPEGMARMQAEAAH